MSSDVEKALVILLILTGFVFLLFKLFRAIRPLSLLRITPRDRRWLRRNKMWPYYILFAFFLLIPVVAIIYKIIKTFDRFTE